MSDFAYWAVVPAAGIGKRFGAAKPKQYLTIGPHTVIEHTLSVLQRFAPLKAIAVAVSADDPHWHKVRGALGAQILAAPGGPERCHSVLNGIEALLASGASEDDRVLVHDAVRPCLRLEDVQTLVDKVGADRNGGLLALPMNDTVKVAADDGSVLETLPRERLWRALTPQLFVLGELRARLCQVIESSLVVTDEAQAMELGGYRPNLVEGSSDNIKITRQEDLTVAEFYVRKQSRL